MGERTRARQRTGTGQNTQRTYRVTINDVAEALGLAKGTVSRALNGYPDISAQTRLRVSRMAEAMGYAPLAPAQAIKTGSSRSVALVLHTGEPDAQRPFLADFIAGITTAASEQHWSLTVATAETDDALLDTMRRLTRGGKADGFIVPRTKTYDPRIDLCRDLNVPFVLYGRTGNEAQCAWFDILGEQAMSDAVDRLYDLGHRRIGYINGAQEYHFSRLRLKGFRSAMLRVGLQAHLVLRGATTAEEGRVQARAALTSGDRPTALVCATDQIALGVYRAAEDLGLQIGADLSVIGYGSIPESAVARPGLTTFEADNRLAGERLASLLIDRIRGKAPELLRETMPARLVVRSSDRPLARPKSCAEVEKLHAPQQSDIQGGD